MTRLLTFTQVMELTAVGRSQIYRKIKTGEFPAPVRVGVKSIRFRDEDVQDWIDGLPTRQGVGKDVERG